MNNIRWMKRGKWILWTFFKDNFLKISLLFLFLLLKIFKLRKGIKRFFRNFWSFLCLDRLNLLLFSQVLHEYILLSFQINFIFLFNFLLTLKEVRVKARQIDKRTFILLFSLFLFLFILSQLSKSLVLFHNLFPTFALFSISLLWKITL